MENRQSTAKVKRYGASVLRPCFPCLPAQAKDRRPQRLPPDALLALSTGCSDAKSAADRNSCSSLQREHDPVFLGCTVPGSRRCRTGA